VCCVVLQGKEYTGDAVICLQEWTSRDLLSEACKESFPAKAEPVKKTLSAKEKAKADARRKIRNTAAKMAREL
jgi:hypothetical protein